MSACDERVHNQPRLARGPRGACRRHSGQAGCDCRSALVSASNVTVVSTDVPSLLWLRRIVALLPGLALLLVIGYAGKLAEQSIATYGRAHMLTLPNIEYVLWAIVFGLAVSNTVGVP